MGWLDLIDLAIDVKQSSDLYKARKQLQRIEEGALEESLRRQVIEVLRNFVFAAANEVKTLEEHLEEMSQPVYVAGRVLTYRFEDVGITPEVFPEFSDKEYVKKVQEDLAKVNRDARSKLSQEEIAQSEECVRAFVEMPLLERAIERYVIQRQLESTEEEWREKSSKKRLMWPGIMLLIVSPVICLCVQFTAPMMSMVLAGGEGIGGALGNIVGILLLLVSFGIPLGFLVLGIVLIVKGSVSGYKDLKESRQRWRDSLPNQSEWGEIVNLFGEQDEEGYRRIKAEKEELILNVMGALEGTSLSSHMLPPTALEGEQT